jgi:hypothetical protein
MAGLEVKRTSLVATVNAAIGGKPEVWHRGGALDQSFRKRLISSKNRTQAGSCSRNKWFRPGKAMK